MLKINQLKLNPVKNESKEAELLRLRERLASFLRIKKEDISDLRILKKSIDARKKDSIYLSYSLSFACKREKELLGKFERKGLCEYSPKAYSPFFYEKAADSKERILIAGFGPAGIFAAYLLALNGYRPLVLERGSCIEERSRQVEEYFRGGSLLPDSNIHFGEGGAGTFSDGKLYTQVKDPEGRLGFILKTFAEFGAPESICYEQHAHIGTDVLKKVIRAMRERLLAMGAGICFQEKLESFTVTDGHIKEVLTSRGRRLAADRLILATGHSCRDTFEMLEQKGLDMRAKAFAAGYRVMHEQRDININQYGEAYADFFEAAPYKLTSKSSSGRGVFSFCMCPGGYVVDASSEEGKKCVNGMSYSGRNGRFANSAIVVTINEEDFENPEDPLSGLKFQRQIEEGCYRAGGGRIPVQSFRDFVRKEKGVLPEGIDEGIKGEFVSGNLRGILPPAVEEAFIEGMEAFDRNIKDFSQKACMAGVESRTSSPVRILRNEEGESSVRGIYPCGEGAGYAGGIMSAALDGMRTAERIMESINGKQG